MKNRILRHKAKAIHPKRRAQPCEPTGASQSFAPKGSPADIFESSLQGMSAREIFDAFIENRLTECQMKEVERKMRHNLSFANAFAAHLDAFEEGIDLDAPTDAKDSEDDFRASEASVLLTYPDVLCSRP